MNADALLNNYFVSSCPEGVLAFDNEKVIRIWSPVMEKMFGITASEAVGKRTDDMSMPAFFHDSPRSFVEDALRGYKFTLTLDENDSNGYPNIEISYFPLLEEDKKVVGGMAFFKETDKHIMVSKAAKKLYERFHDVLETINESFAVLDKQWRYTYLNHHAANFFKVPQEKIIGKVIWDLFPDAKEEAIYPHFHQAMEERKPVFFEVHIAALNKWFENRVFPIENGIAVFFHDITHRKKQQEFIINLNEKLEEQNKDLTAQEEELRSQQEDLRQSLFKLEERNFELDQIIYKTSHDLRSPLTSIMGLVNLAKTETHAPTIAEYILLIENRIAKLDEFVRSMLDFSKANRTPIEVEEINFTQLIEYCFQSLQYIPVYNQIDKQVTIEGGLYIGDLLRLKIIFTNLISNALKYLNIHAQEHLLNIDIQISPQNVSIIVADNGIGIKDAYIPRVFDMFFRGTDKSEGSGLGLYIVKQTVDKLKGSINIISTEGKGTSIHIQLPNMAK